MIAPRRFAKVGLVAIVALTSVSCGGATTVAPPQPPASGTDYFSQSYYSIPPADLTRILNDPLVSDYIKHAYRDGKVTFVEYEVAVLDTISCLRELGMEFRPADPRLTARGIYVWAMRGSGPAPGGDTKAEFDAIAACHRNFLQGIDWSWEQVVKVPEREQAAATAELKTCMSMHGLDSYAETATTLDDMRAMPGGLPPEARQEFLSCAYATQEKWALPGFLPERWDAE